MEGRFHWDEKDIVKHMLKDGDRYGIITITTGVTTSFGRRVLEYTIDLTILNANHSLVLSRQLATTTSAKLGWMAAKWRSSKMMEEYNLKFIKIVRDLHLDNEPCEFTIGYAMPQKWMSSEWDGSVQLTNQWGE